MPNPYSVYMHDTPSRNLFADDYRFDSHGCTRVDNVRDLAAWVLEDVPGWNRDAIDAGIATGHLKVINLTHRIPVAWIYVTGWVSRDGTVNFRDDVYKHDETLDRDALADVAAGGFAVPALAATRAPPRQRPELGSRKPLTHEVWYSRPISGASAAAPTRRIQHGSVPSSLAPLAMRGAE